MKTSPRRLHRRNLAAVPPRGTLEQKVILGSRLRVKPDALAEQGQFLWCAARMLPAAAADMDAKFGFDRRWPQARSYAPLAMQGRVRREAGDRHSLSVAPFRPLINSLQIVLQPILVTSLAANVRAYHFSRSSPTSACRLSPGLQR